MTSYFKIAFVAAATAVALVGCASPGYVGGASQYGYSNAYQAQRYGTVSHITYIPAGGNGGTRAVGAVAGGVLGGVIGHQFGKGRGRTALTIIGATAGAAAGSTAVAGGSTAPAWYVHVNFDDGYAQRFRFDNNPGVRVGQRVRMQGGRLYR